MPAQQKKTEWLATILNSMNEGLMVTDAKGLITMLNPTAQFLLGITPKAAMGAPLRDILNLVHRETHTPLRLPTVKSFQKEHRPRFMDRAVLITSSGRARTVNVVFSPLQSGRTRTTGIIVNFRDIGRMVVKDQAIVDRQKVQAIGQLANNVANDFFTALNLVAGHASSISDNVIPGTRAHTEAVNILHTIKKTGGLTRRLLSLAKAAETDVKVAIEQVDLQKIIENAIGIAKVTFASEKIEFHVQNPHGMPDVMANAEQLTDCLLNMFRNAYEAMPQGGSITVDVSQKAEGAKRFAVLRVRDTGVGISREILDRIFQPLFTTKGGSTSMGLGLNLLQTAVESWGGYVKVRSKPGQGASFRVFIPMAPVQPQRTRKQFRGTDEVTILAIDDNVVLLNEMLTTLKKAGYRVMGASNAHQALDLYHQHGPEMDLAIIDVFMPNGNGKQVLETILQEDPSATIIMTSGFSRDFVRGYIERGAWEFIQKPFDTEHLLSTIRRTLESHDSVEALPGHGAT